MLLRMASAVLLAGVLLAAGLSLEPPPSQSGTGGGGSECGPHQGLGRGARGTASEGPRGSECQSTSREGLRRGWNSTLAKVLGIGSRTDMRPRGRLSTQNEQCQLENGHKQPQYAATFPPRPLPRGEKNLSSLPLDANRDLVELFYVFFKPNGSLVSMPAAEPNRFTVAQPRRFTLRDTSQKVVHLVRNRLVASLQTSNKPPAEISVVPNPYLDTGTFPIIMSVGDGTLCLYSEMAARPVLRLQNRHIMDVYRDSSAAAKPFTFTCTFSGNTQRFEMVVFPGWFLSTSQQSNKPVRLTNRLGATEITDFYFRKV